MKNGLPFSILVVDDDEDDRFALDEAFMQIRYESEVKKFINGKALLHYMDSIEPDLYPSLIVLDNNLPGLVASDLLVILKSNPKYRDIPVVIYATSLPTSLQNDLISKGAFTCMEKGTTMEEIVEVAKELKLLAVSNKDIMRLKKM